LNVNGRKAVGGYAFSFSLRGGRQGLKVPLVIFDISLSLSLAEPTNPIVTSIPSSTQLLQCHTFPNNSEQLYFEAILTKEQINAIEDYRMEKDLRLNLGLRALTAGGDVVQSSFDCTDVIISREHWLRALKSSGFRQILLFEVPLPSAAGELIAILHKAQEFIEIGHYKDAVMQCRHIVEYIENTRNDKRLSVGANKKAQNRQERENMTAVERMLSLREHLKNVCHLGAHGSEDFTRSQAKAVLGMTMALLAEPTVGFAEPLGMENGIAIEVGID